MIAVGVIPARYASTRLPGKPLHEIAGKPLIQHVYERARAATRLDSVLVATDDGRIARAVRTFGGDVVLTSPDHQTGTDRVAEACTGLTFDVAVNIQGDQALVDPGSVDSLVAALGSRPDVEMATLASAFDEPGDADDPSSVKVVLDRQGFALYFSRLPIPCYRDGASGPRWKHLGIYAFRDEALRRFASLPRTALEQAESLEQLRALEHGMRILVLPAAHDAMGVDVTADLERVRGLAVR